MNYTHSDQEERWVPFIDEPADGKYKCPICYDYGGVMLAGPAGYNPLDPSYPISKSCECAFPGNIDD